MTPGSGAEVDDFAVRIAVRLRPGGEADLAPLEWWGWFAAHREIVRDAFDACRDGGGFFLVAEAQGFPIGQAWVDLRQRRSDSCAILWALRVLPGFQGRGIGTRLITASERRAAASGFAVAEISVERSNPRARRLYESLGYALVGERRLSQIYRDPDGAAAAIELDQWVMEKRLSPSAAARQRRISPR